MAMVPDYYAVLKLRGDADAAQVKAAFRALIARWHPDRSAAPEAQARSAEIIEAYRTLSDPQRRILYDRRRRDVGPPGGIERRAARTATPRPAPPPPPPRFAAPGRAVSLAWGGIATLVVLVTSGPELATRDVPLAELSALIAGTV